MNQIISTADLAKARDIAHALSGHAEEVATAILGGPSSRSRRELRWGRHGSMWLGCIGERRGRWYDHELGEGGDLLDLIARERSVTIGAAIQIAKEMLGGSYLATKPTSKHQPLPNDDAASRTALALRIWRQSVPLKGTLGERYFIEHRKLAIDTLPVDHALRWNSDAGAVIALMTDAETGEPVGVHRTFLDSAGAKLERKMLGRQGVVRLSPEDAVSAGLGIAEGIEDALAVLLSGWSPVWAATSAGAIARLPVLGGVETLTVFADADEPGLQAAHVCCDRWREAGREVAIASPNEVA